MMRLLLPVTTTLFGISIYLICITHWLAEANNDVGRAEAIGGNRVLSKRAASKSTTSTTTTTTTTTKPSNKGDNKKGKGKEKKEGTKHKDKGSDDAKGEGKHKVPGEEDRRSARNSTEDDFAHDPCMMDDIWCAPRYSRYRWKLEDAEAAVTAAIKDLDSKMSLLYADEYYFVETIEATKDVKHYFKRLSNLFLANCRPKSPSNHTEWHNANRRRHRFIRSTNLGNNRSNPMSQSWNISVLKDAKPGLEAFSLCAQHCCQRLTNSASCQDPDHLYKTKKSWKELVTRG